MLYLFILLLQWLLCIIHLIQATYNPLRGHVMKTIAIIGTFDTKGTEYEFLRKKIESQGLKTLMIHAGGFPPAIHADISNEQVAGAVGQDIHEIIRKNDRALVTDTMSRGIEALLPKLYEKGLFQGAISFGGSGGTSIAAPGMRALPVGVPKIIVSTVASGDVSVYVGTSDLVMFPSIVDISGLNWVSRTIFTNAANAVAGMVKNAPDPAADDNRPIVAATMFGVTTPCIDQARRYLEAHGYEVIVFHATGTGGNAMENLIASGRVRGVLDITTTELADEVCGGRMPAGPARLTTAGRMRIPQVVSVGAADIAVFGTRDTIPEKYAGRRFYQHNPTTTLMRTNIEENIKIGRLLASRLNGAAGKTAMMLPLRGVSMIDADNQPFYGKDEDEALFRTLSDNIDPQKVELIKMDCNINAEDFSLAAASKLIEYMEA